MTPDQSTGVDFFARAALPAPRVTEADARRIAAEHFGLDARADSLGSQQDTNFLMRDADGAPVAVLKVANPAFGAAEIAAQDEAAERIAAAHPSLRVATVLRDADGKGRSALVDSPEGPVTARLLRYLPGGALSGDQYLTPDTVAAIGRIAGQVGTTLRDFEHPGLDRVLQWDPRHAYRVVNLLIGHVPGAERRAALAAATREAWAAVEAVAHALPRQAVHLDLTDDNLVRDAASAFRLPDGVIDFGDLTHSWAVAELAIPLSSVLHHAGMEPHHVLPAVRAFHAVRPLSREEAAALWPLTVLRAATLVVSGWHQAAIDGDNAYVEAALDREWRIFQQAVSVPEAVMSGLIADALGFAATSHTAPAPSRPLLADVSPDAVAVLDLSVESDTMDHGVWLEDDAEDRLAAALLSGGAAKAAVATRYAEPRLTAASVLSAASPATVPTGVDVRLGARTRIQAPYEGRVGRSEPGFVAVEFGDLVLELSWPAPGNGTVVPADRNTAAGDTLATLPAGTRLHILLRRDDAEFGVPPLVRPEYAAGWLALTADPAPLLGLPATVRDTSTPGGLLARRDASFATVQEHYYDAPPRVERGWRHHLVSTDGRAYLDIVNNVTPLGHAHPRVEQAVARQLRRLNTNSRFHYGAVVEFTERLAALLPDPLDTVFLVNSGSEAVDLAIRLAIGATGRHDVVSLLEAYHGWTYASDAVSTSVADNPNALASRPDWVHPVDAPNPYRGRYRGAEASRYAADAVAEIDRLAAAGRPAGAFVSESFYGNAGGVPLPDGYLRQVYAAVRRHGGLAIADEIQAGYGRLGDWFWGFEQQDAVPDIVTVAKAMGNGHPLGAVVTTRAIADRYRDQGYFFSSTGGSPVSSVAGLTVLDTLRDEDLQGNAVRVGRHLKARLTALVDRHPLVGAVHGSGLYLGVELVRDRVTLEPAREETAALCDRMLELGVIVQPTGDHLNVLKIKPPLCVDEAAADFFADTLDRALAELTGTMNRSISQ
ncbi:aminotransferase [Yinghuangia seranimata]|uniref:aminotransferase n=1 Tax=Yinghuangia seranimata TaxID=408067 RepID=UPI00248BA48E|nr:aminotransferase [Yinghuangia seranimata]MDI2130895.1 aminotransferase [Yinghuangia seranimata]